MTREQMESEFGRPGVQNPQVMDLITVDKATDTVELVMIESRPWDSSALQFRQIEEKINRYMAYALDGFLVEHHPDYQGKSVRIRLDCVAAPSGRAIEFVAAAKDAIEREGLGFAVKVTGPDSS